MSFDLTKDQGAYLETNQQRGKPVFPSIFHRHRLPNLPANNAAQEDARESEKRDGDGAEIEEEDADKQGRN